MTPRLRSHGVAGEPTVAYVTSRTATKPLDFLDLVVRFPIYPVVLATAFVLTRYLGSSELADVATAADLILDHFGADDEVGIAAAVDHLGLNVESFVRGQWNAVELVALALLRQGRLTEDDLKSLMARALPGAPPSELLQLLPGGDAPANPRHPIRRCTGEKTTGAIARSVPPRPTFQPGGGIPHTK